MIDKKELVFCVDSRNLPIDPLPRFLAHEKGVWHRSSEIWIFNTTFSYILCNKRSNLKDTNPGLSDCTFGGHVLAGEEPIYNAINELAEELSIEVKMDQLQPVEVLPDQNLRHFVYRYIHIYEGDLSELVYEKDEIDTLFWLASGDLLSLYKTHSDNRWVYRPQGYNFLRKLQQLRAKGVCG